MPSQTPVADTIRAVTIQHGTDGGIVNASGNLVLTDVVITRNIATTWGGGIWSTGSLTMTDTVVSDNQAPSGGGIYSLGTATLLRSTVAGNTAQVGGGIFGNVLTLTLTSSAIVRNTAASGGGAIHALIVAASMLNSTISDNHTTGTGAGGYYRAYSGGSGGELLTLTHVTFADNGVSIGRDPNAFAYIRVKNTIVADACDFPGLGPTLPHYFLISQDYNIDAGDTCGFIGGNDRVNTDPRLLPLAGYTYPPPDRDLRPDSPAIDSVPVQGSGCPLTDQRGIERPQGAICDRGAVEYAVMNTLPPPLPSSPPGGTSATLPPPAPSAPPGGPPAPLPPSLPLPPVAGARPDQAPAPRYSSPPTGGPPGSLPPPRG
jgi:predicted outer membrane repeat protein